MILKYKSCKGPIKTLISTGSALAPTCLRFNEAKYLMRFFSAYQTGREWTDVVRFGLESGTEVATWMSLLINTCMTQIFFIRFSSVLRIRDVYPGSRILIFIHPRSRNPDPTKAPKEEGENIFFVLPFFVATNIIKLYVMLFWTFNFLSQNTKHYSTFFQKFFI